MIDNRVALQPVSVYPNRIANELPHVGVFKALGKAVKTATGRSRFGRPDAQGSDAIEHLHPPEQTRRPTSRRSVGLLID